ncbi:hypothetical protein D3C77_548120 [compost metagenome]
MLIMATIIETPEGIRITAGPFVSKILPDTNRINKLVIATTKKNHAALERPRSLANNVMNDITPPATIPINNMRIP